MRRLITRASSARGQSLVELALVLPVLLLIMLMAIDFGRIYLGYINLQQLARIAANFAADHASQLDGTPDPAVQQQFQNLVTNDTHAINCALPRDGAGNLDIPDPAFPDGVDLGDRAQVTITCSFDVITPIIGEIFPGGQILLGATATFPVKEGAVSVVPGGGPGTAVPPVANFIGSPRTGYSPLVVTLTDTSTGAPTSWTWNFGVGTAFTKGPHTRTYTCAGTPGDTCTFSVQLQVGNSGGFSTKTAVNYITVTVPPTLGPIAEFTASPRSGTNPLSVSFAFSEVTTGIAYTAWDWDFDGDGVVDDSGQSVSHTYAAPGNYTVTLAVTDSAGATDSQTKTDFIVVTKRTCTVPDFAGVRRNGAQTVWNNAGFTTSVSFVDGNGNYLIRTQSLLGGTIDPMPNGCASLITVGP